MKEIKTEYYIKDWAGNYMFNYMTFSTYEEASDFLLCRFPDDEDLQEYCIDKVDDKFAIEKDRYEFMLILEDQVYTNEWADRVRHLIN